MARVDGVTRERAGGLLRLFYRVAERMVGKLPEPLTIQALNRPILQAASGFEFFLGRANKVPTRLKVLAELEAATLTGCPF